MYLEKVIGSNKTNWNFKIVPFLIAHLPIILFSLEFPSVWNLTWLIWVRNIKAILLIYIIKSKKTAKTQHLLKEEVFHYHILYARFHLDESIRFSAGIFFQYFSSVSIIPTYMHERHPKYLPPVF